MTQTMTLARWFTLDAAARAVVMDQLLERVPPGFIDPRSVGHRAGPLPQFIHGATNVLFHVVFGGEAVIGMSDARAQRLVQVEGAPAEAEEDGLIPIAQPGEYLELTPARRVHVPTCLVADHVLPWGVLRHKLSIDEAQLSISGVRGAGVGAVLKALVPLGWRLPSEAEWEFVCRAAEDAVDDRRPPVRPTGRLADTSLVQLGAFIELCRDTWNDTLAGLPEVGPSGMGHEVLRGHGRGGAFSRWSGSPAWNEALWPGRRRLAHYSGVISFRPWVDLVG